MTTDEIRFFEELAANGFPALNIQQYDGWLLRFSNGYTGRANSVSVLYPSSIALDEKIDYCEKCYENHNMPCLFKLTDSEADKPLNDMLKERGYRIVSPTNIMTLDLSELCDDTATIDGKCGSVGELSAKVVFTQEPTEEWFASFFAFKGLDNKQNQSLCRQILSKIQAKTLYASIIQDGKTVACASTVTERGCMLLHNVVVSPEKRGHGFGKLICRSLIEKAKEDGEKLSYLQVMQNNEIAQNLYEKLGFKKEYSYWYMRKQ